MPWSPPKKETFMLSFLLEVIGVAIGLAALGLIQIESLNLDEIYVAVGLGLCFLGWLLLVIGTRFSGIRWNSIKYPVHG